MLLRKIFRKSTISRLNPMTFKIKYLFFIHCILPLFIGRRWLYLWLFNTRYIITRAECDLTNYGILNIRALFIERKEKRKYLSLHPEAVAWKCSVKKVFQRISQNSQENTRVRTSFLMKLQQVSACNFISKDTPAQVFSCEFYEIVEHGYPDNCPLGKLPPPPPLGLGLGLVLGLGGNFPWGQLNCPRTVEHIL